MEINHPVPPLAVDAGRATEVVQRWYKDERSHKRKLPPASRYIQKASDENTVIIFNVGPWTHMQQMGSLGTFCIPAYDSEKDEKKLGYSLMSSPIPGVFIEYYPEDKDTMRPIFDDGDYVAEQILGIGPMMDPRNSLIRYGVGFEKGIKPSEKSLSDARARLIVEAERLFEEAENAAANGPTALQHMRTERHLWAARTLGRQDAVWMTATFTQKRQKCELCGTYSDPDVVMCPNHTNMPYIFDQKRFDEIRARTKRAN